MRRFSLLLSAIALLAGCASSDTQRYFHPQHAAKGEAGEATARVLFVRQTVREVVMLVRLENRGSTPLSLVPTGPVPSWSLAIEGRTLPLTETDRTYWSAWSGTVTRDRSPLKTTQILEPGGRAEVEVRWRFEPPMADARSPWVLTIANLERQGTAIPPMAIAFPAIEVGWTGVPVTNPNQTIQPGFRSYTNVPYWNAPARSVADILE